MRLYSETRQYLLGGLSFGEHALAGCSTYLELTRHTWSPKDPQEEHKSGREQSKADWIAVSLASFLRGRWAGRERTAEPLMCRPGRLIKRS